eukprot:GFYU01001725.1.p1 GENE.GFYU01001725.1~~GFYU01001725.1.p1  ORF type:complete len:257 (+),score=26.75 GFYU01001725.1:471-1241(+)
MFRMRWSVGRLSFGSRPTSVSDPGKPPRPRPAASAELTESQGTGGVGDVHSDTSKRYSVPHGHGAAATGVGGDSGPPTPKDPQADWATPRFTRSISLPELALFKDMLVRIAKVAGNINTSDENKLSNTVIDSDKVSTSQLELACKILETREEQGKLGTVMTQIAQQIMEDNVATATNLNNKSAQLEDLELENQILHNQLNTLEDASVCPICMDKSRSLVLDPCGHTFCEPCLCHIGDCICPICREPFNKFIPFYLG